MSRAAFLHMLESYKTHAAWPEEQPIVEKLIQFVKNTPNCFERPTHDGQMGIAISVLLLNHDMSRALLGKHKEFDTWIQIGGRMDGEKNAFAAAEKEIAEKTGIVGVHFHDDKPIDIAVYQTQNPSCTLFDVRFLVVAPEGTREKMSDKFSKSRWVDAGEATILAQNDETLQRLLMKWAKAYRRYMQQIAVT